MAPDVASLIYVQFGLSRFIHVFFGSSVAYSRGGVWQKRADFGEIPNAAMGVLDENHRSALMHDSLIL